MNSQKTRQQGFVKLIILFIIFCIIVWYFKLDVRGYVDSHPQIKSAFTDITNYLSALWKKATTKLGW